MDTQDQIPPPLPLQREKFASLKKKGWGDFEGIMSFQLWTP
jgi:hypothetical protein